MERQLTADIKIAGKPYGKLTVTRRSGAVLDVIYAKAGWDGAEEKFEMLVADRRPERIVAFALLAKLGKELQQAEATP